MRRYNLGIEGEKLLSPKIVNIISSLHEYRGIQNLHIKEKKNLLVGLFNLAKIQSIEYSNKIEGIKTKSERIKILVNKEDNPQTRDEEEIAGYRDVLEMIHESYDKIPITPSVILQFHKMLYKHSNNYSGNFKTTDNVIEELDKEVNKKLRFKPVSAFETERAINELCLSYNKEIKKGEIDSLLLIVIFVFDFLSIHPFSDGNGRISRLLTLLLLYQNNYGVGKYISLEKLIENTKEEYYDVLKKSSKNWHENKSEYSHFAEYYLKIIQKANISFENRIEYIQNNKLTVKNRVRDILLDSDEVMTKKEIAKIMLDVHEGSVERALYELQKENTIIKLSGGRATRYIIKKV